MTEAVLTQTPDAPEVGRAGAQPVVAPDPRVKSYVESFARCFDEVERGLEPAWLGTQRRAGIASFERLGFPTSKNEDWHFTSVAPIKERAYSPAVNAGSTSAADLAPYLFDGDWQTLVFVNGRFAPELSQIESIAGKLYSGTMSDALANAKHAQHIQKKLAGLAVGSDHAFTALNSAFMQDGAFIALRGDVVTGRPVHVIHVTDGSAEGALLSPRSLIVLDHHAEATVVESYVSVGDAEYFTNAVTEVYVGDGARLRHYKVQREAIGAYHVGSWYTHQERGSNYEAFSLATGANLSRTNVMTVLDGEGAHATLNGLYMVNGEQTVDHQTSIVHAKESCTSHEVYKGVLDGNSHAVFNGKVYVHPEAQKTDGKQSNNNLLLSPHARVDTKPQLEIYADDVKCTHGATIGRLDANSLFYLKSRGIGDDVSRKLLTYAFAADVIEELTVDSVREKLESLAFSRFAVA